MRCIYVLALSIPLCHRSRGVSRYKSQSTNHSPEAEISGHKIRRERSSRCTIPYHSIMQSITLLFIWSMPFDQHWMAQIPIKVSWKSSLQGQQILLVDEQKKKMLSTVTTMLLNPHHFSYLRALFHCRGIDKLPFLGCLLVVKVLWSRWRLLLVRGFRYALFYSLFCTFTNFFIHQNSNSQTAEWVGADEWRVKRLTNDGLFCEHEIPHCQLGQINKQLVNGFHFTLDLTQIDFNELAAQRETS